MPTAVPRTCGSFATCLGWAAAASILCSAGFVNKPLTALAPIQDEDVVRTDNTNALSFSPDGKLLVHAGPPDQVTMWNLIEKKLVWQIPREGIRCVAYSPKGDIVVTSGYGWTIEIRSAPTGKVLKELKGPAIHPVNALAFSPDGKLLASGSWSTKGQNVLVLWNLETGKVLFSLDSAKLKTIYSLAFTPDGSKLIVGSGEKFVPVYEVPNGKELRRLEMGAPALAVSVSADGKMVASTTDYIIHGAKEPEKKAGDTGLSTTMIWSLEDGKRAVGPLTTGSMVSAAFARQKDLLVFINQDDVCVFNTSKAKVTNKTSYPGFMRAMAMSPLGDAIALVDPWDGIHVLNLGTMKFTTMKAPSKK